MCPTCELHFGKKKHKPEEKKDNSIGMVRVTISVFIATRQTESSNENYTMADNIHNMHHNSKVNTIVCPIVNHYIDNTQFHWSNDVFSSLEIQLKTYTTHANVNKTYKNRVHNGTTCVLLMVL